MGVVQASFKDRYSRGRIWWDEANTAFQPFYSLLDAKVGLTIGHLDISIWGSNLLNTGYGTFRFRSVGRDFIAVGRTGQLVREDGRMDVILREVSFSPRMQLTMDIGGCPSSYLGIKE